MTLHTAKYKVDQRRNNGRKSSCKMQYYPHQWKFLFIKVMGIAGYKRKQDCNLLMKTVYTGKIFCGTSGLIKHMEMDRKTWTACRIST